MGVSTLPYAIFIIYVATVKIVMTSQMKEGVTNLKISPQITKKKGKLLIDGNWVDSVSGKEFETINPATGEVITSVALAGAADVDLAVKGARRAFTEGPWSTMHPGDRGRILYQLAQLIREHRDELATIDTRF